MSEEWRPIPGYEGRYEASSEGRIRHVHVVGSEGLRDTRILKPSQGRRVQEGMLRYTRLYVSLAPHRGGKLHKIAVHRLVTMAFHGPPPFPGATVNHRDGNRLNNWADNLEWLSQEANNEAWLKQAVAAGRFAHACLNMPKGALDFWLRFCRERSMDQECGIIQESIDIQEEILRSIACGWVWKCRMKNGVQFTVVMPESMRVRGRANARRELLKLANGPPAEGDDEPIYHSSNIASLWEARS